ncbi:MAG: HD domain-containing phosphohydrolase [Nitrospirota bacterium]
MDPFTSFIKGERPSILVVDDFQPNLELMEAVFLKEGFRVYTALGADAAIEVFRQYPPDLAVLDVMMPGIDGFELCRRFKDISGKRFFPVILLTALTDRKSRIRGIESGADDFISKPFDTSELIAKIKSLLKLKALQEELDHSENIILTLAVAMEARDPYTKGHSTRVSELSVDFVSFLGLPQKDREEIKKAGILHDIGKICLSKSLLHKPGALTEEEADVIRRHTVLGEEICRPLFSMRRILPAIRHHHERWDGRGFPDRLAGEDIPIMARILSIVDSFDAMVSIRPYRDPIPVKTALEIMQSSRYKGQWDPELLGYFLETMSSVADKVYKIDVKA